MGGELTLEALINYYQNALEHDSALSISLRPIYQETLRILKEHQEAH